MDMYDEGGLPTVDDLTLVAEIAEAELQQMEKIKAAAERAKSMCKRNGKHAEGRGGTAGANKHENDASTHPEREKV